MHFNSQLLISLFFIPLILGACGSTESNTLDPAREEDKSIVLSPNGIGPINVNSSFNMHQMTLAFSDYNVVEEVGYQSGSPYPVIRISKGIKTLLVINPDATQKNIFSIIIEDNLIKNSLGHRLGTPYNEVYPYGQTEDCQMGLQDMAGKVLCYAPKAPNILYVFNGKTNSVSSVIPPINELQNWALESIIWRPK